MRREQSGIFLVSAALAVGVVGILVTFWGVEQGRQMRIERAERIGESLKMVGNAVETFTVKHHGEIEKLLSGASADFRANNVTFSRSDKTGPGGTPELANLTAESVIKALELSGVATVPPRGMGEYQVRVYRVCDAGSTTSCRIDTLTYLTEPIKKTYSSEPDFNLAAVAAKKMGAYGGVSTAENASEFKFTGQSEGALPVGNPLDRPGLIAMRGGSQTKDLNIAMVRDGSRGATGPLRMYVDDTNGGKIRQNIEGVADIESGGTISAPKVVMGVASVTGRLDLKSGTDAKPVFNNIVGAGNIEGAGELKMASASVGALTATTDGATLSGKLDLQNNDIESAKSVSADKVSAEKVESRDLKSKSGVVELGDAVTAGEVCDVWGLGRDTAGRILSCQQDDGKAWRWTLAMRSPTVSPATVKDKEPPIQPVVDSRYRDDGRRITKFVLATSTDPNRERAFAGFKLGKDPRGSTVCKLGSAPVIMGVAIEGFFKNAERMTLGDTVAPSENLYIAMGLVEKDSAPGEMICLSQGADIPSLQRVDLLLGPRGQGRHVTTYGAGPRFSGWVDGTRPVVGEALQTLTYTETSYEGVGSKTLFNRRLREFNQMPGRSMTYEQGRGGGWKTVN